MKGIIERLKGAFTKDERPTEMSYMPKEERGDAIPKFTLRKEVNGQGGIYLPVSVREQENRSDVEPGDAFTLDVFTPRFCEKNRHHEKRDHYEKYVGPVTVNKGNRITIPAEVREELDIREGDEIAVHAYWTQAEE